MNLKNRKILQSIRSFKQSISFAFPSDSGNFIMKRKIYAAINMYLQNHPTFEKEF